MKSSKNASRPWGELPIRQTQLEKQEVITPDMIENVWRQAVLDETKNSDSDYQVHRPLHAQIPMGNSHVLNTINLRQQLRFMESGKILKNMTEVDGGSQDPKELHNVMMPNILTRKKFKNNPQIPQLKPKTAQGLLEHAVIILLAHIGFDTASDHAISTITDVADYFLKRMALLLKIASEEKNCGFQDAMEKVLLEVNVGGVVGLHEYYEEYVLQHEKNLREKVLLKIEQQKLLEFNNCNIKMELEETESKHHFDELNEFGNVYRDVPTLQLLDPEMGFPPSLDAGFQMLHSLEQDELNNLSVDEEDANITDSPSTAHLLKK